MRRVTRRGVLAGIGWAGGLAGVGSGRGRARTDRRTVTVATRNCYLGGDLFDLFAAAAGDETIQSAVTDLVAAVDRSRVGRRLDAIAGELSRTEPDLVGIQEAALIRSGPRSDGTTPTATDVRYDFRERLLSALDARDLPYRVVATTEPADVQLPATVEGEPRDVRLTDRDLILAHERVATDGTTTGTFDAGLSLSVDDRTVAVDRGYEVVEASVGDLAVTFCNTHLESASAEVRAAQAAELRDRLVDRAGPVVLVGDCNSGPGGSTAAYDHLTADFGDAAGDAGVGATCCHAADLRNADPSLDARIDHVLVGDRLRVADATRVGADPTERIAADGERLWPSDHAGVVATLVPADPTTASPTPSPTERETEAGTEAGTTPTVTGTESDADAPGFGVVATVVSVVAAATVAARRHDD
ncbi:endonuclease/exonuclease/phosphatase family protein [Haloplanus salilacus]|uniref:endonuclease/exonuclease/phosphatase family protein n=1 Tax=Haloplanus salilacus TaxID=2949994 RepID=UPI0030D382FA